ncbi:hypothetical protein C8F04DRAFT_1064751 [Mycena alexandri]|uniref:Uncharacterized protein n=1 Tax=Mycena alexandri TaxID=1745969 RepID=A0AAD6TIA4_9AGAR|nr:hypothetical protein C8F04DRAFT_1064751 [Mycena alexandri]
MKSLADEKVFDSRSVLSDRTLCASPEPFEPPPCVPRVPAISVRPRPETPLTGRVRARSVAVVAFALWAANFSLSLVEYFQSVRDDAPRLQLRVLVVWAVCSGIFVVIAANVFLSTLFRRPSWTLVVFLRGLAILMSATSCIVGFAVVFPVIAECTRDQIQCSGKEHALRLFVCGGVPIASIWTWVWIPTIRKFLQEL